MQRTSGFDDGSLSGSVSISSSKNIHCRLMMSVPGYFKLYECITTFPDALALALTSSTYDYD
jgi:hypothetical protein